MVGGSPHAPFARTLCLLCQDKPLVIPEINGKGQVDAPLIANPNCTTAVGAMALWPIHQKYKLKKAGDLAVTPSS